MSLSGSSVLSPPEVAGVTDLRIETYPWKAWPEIEPSWSELVRSLADTSFFLSTDWVSTWLETFGPVLAVCIAAFMATDKIVGVCLLANSVRARSLLRLRRVSLNTSGESVNDTTYMEGNTLLCLPGWEEAVVNCLKDHLRGRRWDEFALDGFVPGAAYDAFQLAFWGCPKEELSRSSCYADLTALRGKGCSFESALGRATRKHLRQDRRAMEAKGAARLSAAGSVTEALAMFDELAMLNRQRWTGRGALPFASPLFLGFHRALVAKCYGSGRIQLLRQQAGGETIGLVYNLIRGKTVYFYQCGFNYQLDRVHSPGILTLTEVIQYYLDRGFDTFDFLSGDATYKVRLATGSHPLVWTVFRNPGLKTQLIRAVRNVRGWFRHQPHSDTLVGEEG